MGNSISVPRNNHFVTYYSGFDKPEMASRVRPLSWRAGILPEGHAGAVARLLAGAPAAHIPRPLTTVGLDRAVSALGDFIDAAEPFSRTSPEVHHGYLKLAAMRLLIGRALATEELLNQAAEFKLQIGADRTGRPAQRDQAPAADFGDDELRAIAQALGVGGQPGFETLLFLMMTRYAGKKEKEIIAKMNELAQQASASKIRIGADGPPPAGNPPNITTDKPAPGDPGQPQVTTDPGPGSTTDEFANGGAGLGAGAGHTSNLSNSPEAVLAMSTILGTPDGSGSSIDPTSISFESMQQRLKEEHGIESTVTDVGGHKALKLANGDMLVDSNGDGALGMADYNFAGAAAKIKEKYAPKAEEELAASSDASAVPEIEPVDEARLDFEFIDLTTFQFFFLRAMALAD